MNNVSTSDRKALKSGIWYIVGAVLVKGIGYLTTPIFARLLTQSEYGAYSNFTSWLSIVTVLVTFDMYSTINRARYDYSEDYPCYISTITIFGIVFPLALYLLSIPFISAITYALNIDYITYHCIFIYSIVYSAFNIYQTKERVAYNYKHSVLLSIVISVSTVLISLCLCQFMENKYYARMIGQVAPFFVINAALVFTLIKIKDRTILFKYRYLKYAILIALPYIPHLVCAQLLTTSTRLEITNSLGNESTAVFSIAQTCAFLVNLMSISINNAIAPWIGDHIHKNAFNELRTKLKPIITLFCIMSVLLCLFAPEIVSILGGAKYSGAIPLMPPIICGCMYQFVYTFYVNIETFEKKLWRMSAVTIIAAIVCILLNKVLISVFGLNGAPYSIMVAFFVLLIGNYFNVRMIGKSAAIDSNYVFISMASSTILCMLALLTYSYLVVRIVTILLIFIILIIFIMKNKSAVALLMKKGDD